MATTSVRVDPRTHALLRDLSRQEEKSIGQVVKEAVEEYKKNKFWQEMEEDYDRLRADPRAWQDYQDELALWDSTVNDGLENEEPYYQGDGDGNGE